MQVIITTITPNFQVHIPRQIREQIGLHRSGRAKIMAKGSKIIIEPIKDDFLSLGGAFAVKKPIPAEKIRKVIEYTNKK